MAYVLGFFAADGSMLKNRRGGYFIEFTITDRIVLEHIQQATGSTHRIAERNRGNDAWKLQYRLQIGSKEWFEDLVRLGFTQKKSNTLEFPKIPKQHIGHFIRGYFDGDGCVYFGQHWSKEKGKNIWVFTSSFTCGNKIFLERLHKLLKSFGVKGGHISNKNRGYDLVFSRHDSLALYQLMYHTDVTSNLFLPRKREKLERAMRVLKLDT